MKENCLFCEIIHNNSGKTCDRVLYEDSNFYVVPALGCLVPGYVLIVSKKHVNSMCYLSSNERHALDILIDKVSKLYKSEFGFYPTVFEHGADNNGINKSACCVLHAHMHVIPHEFSLFNEMHDSLNFSRVTSYLEFYSKCYDRSYLLYIHNDKVKYVRVFDDEVSPSQIFRKWVAKDIGIEDQWDWRLYHFDSYIDETVSRMGVVFKKYIST